MKNYFGIDLGTTYSAISKVNPDGKAEVLKNMEGNPTTPSVVNFLEEGGYVVGETAKNDITSEGVVVEEAKKHIGDKEYIYRTNDGEFNPVDVSSLILKKLKEDIEAQGETIDGVVITCPAYFGVVEINNTKAAGELAGLNVLHVINEPTAAAFAYVDNINAGETKHILVYDLGGGTFDITLMKITGQLKSDNVSIKREIEVIESEGDHALGGKDFDKLLIDTVIERGAELLGVDESELRDDNETFRDIVVKVEAAKKMLSSKETTRVNISSPTGGRDRVEITREEFEEMSQSLINRTLELTTNVIDKVNSLGITLDTVLLVGGSTKMPMVRNLLEKFEPLKQVLPTNNIHLHDPDEAVAKGAALWTSFLGDYVNSEKTSTGGQLGLGGIEDEPDVLVIDIINKSYGLVALIDGNEEISNIILKGNKLDPIIGYENTKQYRAVVENQSNIHFRIMENTSTDETLSLEAGSQIFDFTFNLPPNFPLTSNVHVTYHFDKSAILSISVREDYANTSLDGTQIKIEGAFSDEDLEKSREGLRLLGEAKN